MSDVDAYALNGMRSAFLSNSRNHHAEALVGGKRQFALPLTADGGDEAYQVLADCPQRWATTALEAQIGLRHGRWKSRRTAPTNWMVSKGSRKGRMRVGAPAPAPAVGSSAARRRVLAPLLSARAILNSSSAIEMRPSGIRQGSDDAIALA
jgi:hypothetical protein